MSSLRGWWAEGDRRLIRSFALALGVAIAATQLLAAGGLVDLGKTIYLQPSFSAPLMFFGGLLFGYGMVLSNGCGSRALVLLQASQTTATVTSVPALLSTFGLNEISARMLAASAISGALIIFAFAHAPFQRALGQIAAGLVVGLLVAAGWFATGYLGADDFNPTPVTSLTFVALMGAGGAMAYGCSIGQGLTGLSTLALASFVAVAGILLGTAAGLRGVLRVQPLVSAQDARSGPLT